jgi:hypothetical protein
MPNALIKQRAHKPISCDVILFFEKVDRRLTLKNSVHRASVLALRVLANNPALSAGDFRSAAYGAGLIVGLKSSKAPTDWAAFLSQVQTRVEVSLEPEKVGRHVMG